MDHAATERTYQRNFMRRRNAELKSKIVAEATAIGNDIKRVAVEEASRFTQKTLEEANQIIQKATEKANSIIADANCRQDMIDSCVASATARWKELESLLDGHLHNGLASTSTIEPTVVVETSRKRTGAEIQADIAKRQRKSYWKKRELQESQSQLAVQGLNSQSSIPDKATRTTKRVAGILASQFWEKTRFHNFDTKKLVLKTFWENPAFASLHPASFGCPKIDSSIKSSWGDMKDSLQVIKGGQRKDYLATKHGMLTCLSGKLIQKGRQKSSLAKGLNLNRRNIALAVKRRNLLDADSTLRFPMGVRKARSDRISNQIRQEVAMFWEANTRVSPNKKDQARQRITAGVYDKHQVHWLEETEIDFYFLFKEQCKEKGVGIPVGLRVFQHCKPYFIRVLKDRNVCCCKQHVEMNLLREALSKFRVHKHPGPSCQCKCCICAFEVSPGGACKASKQTIHSVREWCDETLCVKAEGQQWHKKDCLMGKCKDCGVHKLRTCELELSLDSNISIQWQTFQYVQLEQSSKRKQDGTAPGKRLRLVYTESTVSAFMDQVKSKMPPFIVHNFRARWQGEQYKKSMAVFPKGTIVSSIDFSENYAFLGQDEVQSMHWDNKQISLLIHATFRHKEEHEYLAGEARPDPTDPEDRHIVTDYHFYISDDNQHDSLFVQHCLDLHVSWLRSEGLHIDRHWVWSDGCAAQFKSRGPFYFVSRYFSTYGIQMQWNFHGSGHGKNVVDGEGGTQKRALAKEQLLGIGKGAKLQNAHDAVEFLKCRFAYGKETGPGKVQLIRRHHWEIKLGDVNRRKAWDCSPIPGSRSLHCFLGFSSTVPTLLKVREMCCFCPICVDTGDTSGCVNEEYAGKWAMEEIHPAQPQALANLISNLGSGVGVGEWEDGDLADTIVEGGFFATEAAADDPWDVDFYILQCSKTAHDCKESFVDDYGVAFKAGDRVVQAKWYQQVGRTLTRYAYSAKVPETWVHSRDVIHTGFVLKAAGKSGADPAFTLPKDTLAAIMGSLERFVDDGA